MANIGEKTLLELDELLNMPERNSSRPLALLEEKTAQTTRNSPQYLFGGCDRSKDNPVDLQKLPSKASNTEEAAKNLIVETQSQATELRLDELENICPLMSPSPASLSNFLPQLSSTLAAERQLTPKPPQSQLAKESPPSLQRAINEDFESSFLVNMRMESPFNLGPSLYERNIAQRSSSPTSRVCEFMRPNSAASVSAKQTNTEQIEDIMRKTHSPNKLKNFTTKPNRDVVATNIDSVTALKQCPLTSTENNVSTENLRIHNQRTNGTKAVQIVDCEYDAQEQMSRYDLRMRNAPGILHVEDGQSKLTERDQTTLEQKINSQLARQQLQGNFIKIRPLRVSIAKLSQTLLRETITEPLKNNDPVDTRSNADKEVQHNEGQPMVVSSNPEHHRYSRIDAPDRIVSKEPCCSKIEIAPAPPASNAADNENIAIVPPPPSNLRFSKAMCRTQSVKHIEPTEEKTEEHYEQTQQCGRDDISRNSETIQKLCDTVTKSSQSMFAPPEVSTLQKTETRKKIGSKSRRNQPPMSEELREYLTLQKSVTNRLKSSLPSCGKRSLYTKGNSDIEDNLSQSQQNKQRPLSKVSSDISALSSATQGFANTTNKSDVARFSRINIAPVPPSKSTDVDDILIVPPPPASLRFSKVKCKSQNLNQTMSNNQEKLVNKQFQHEEPPIVIKQNGMQYNQIQDKEIHENMHLEAHQHRNIQHEEFQHQAMPANFQNNLEHSSLKMETLRMDTPSPTMSSTSQQSLLNEQPSKSKVPSEALDLPMSRSKLKNNKQNAHKPATISQQNLLNEQPSTSKAAREALELFLNRSKSKNNKQDAQKPDAIIQQSLLNEPPSKSKVASEGLELPQQSLLDEQPSRSNATREALELSLNRSQSRNKQDAHNSEKKATKKRLKQSPLTSEPQQSKLKKPKNKERQRLEDSETYPLNEKHFASGIRKSERGHVPLCNTFSHTLDDPFAFMRSPDKKSTNNSNTSSKKKLSSNSNVITSNGDNTRKRKRYPHEDDDAQGNSPNKNVRKRKMTSVNIESTADKLLHTQAEKPERNFQIMAECRSQSVSTLDNLEHSNLNGIECASYPSEIGCSLSYIKFQPFQKWGMAATNSTLNFIVLSGMFEIKNWQESSKLESAILNNGDKVEIPQGCYFILTNLLNKVSVMLFKRILTDNNTLS
ncbi:uncharacterized protein LOC132786127 [Drosophila nasuta]|uniref:uncharacterized protein LOC132786127 n=1 Tax=Drosophila nasuta TaxID=42062 RepID=UPI00295E6F7C|nr:uncharacterized protein LOC132786127 [Drosophila nasuta]